MSLKNDISAFIFAMCISNYAIAMVPTPPEVHSNPPILLRTKFVIPTSRPVTFLSWSPDGNILAAEIGNKLYTYDDKGRSVGQILLGSDFVGFSGDSAYFFSHVAANADKFDALDIRELATGRIVNSVIAKELYEDPSAHGVLDLYALSPDGGRLVTSIGNGRDAVIYAAQENTQNWREISVIKERDSYYSRGKRFWFDNTSICVFYDNRRVAIGKSGGRVAVVDSVTGQTISEFRTYDPPVEGKRPFGTAQS